MREEGVSDTAIYEAVHVKSRASALFYEVDLEKRTVRNRSQYLLLIEL
jgi:hypothetical protein